MDPRRSPQAPTSSSLRPPSGCRGGARFRAYSIDIEEKPIATQVFVSAGDDLFYWNGGFDERFAAQRPALQTLIRAIEDRSAAVNAGWTLAPGRGTTSTVCERGAEARVRAGGGAGTAEPAAAGAREGARLAAERLTTSRRPAPGRCCVDPGPEKAPEAGQRGASRLSAADTATSSRQARLRVVSGTGRRSFGQSSAVWTPKRVRGGGEPRWRRARGAARPGWPLSPSGRRWSGTGGRRAQPA